LTYQYIATLDHVANGSFHDLELFRQYVNQTRQLQHLDTLSGDFETGGIGEPKYIGVCGR